MTFSGHVAIAGITLQLIGDPVVVIVVNLALHPILDAIPHAEWSTFRNSKPKAVAITVFDYVVAVAYIWQLFVWLDQPSWLIIATLVAGLWLDILYPITARYWPMLHRFHLFTHSWPVPAVEPINWNETFTGRTPLWIKLVIQNLLVVLPYVYLIRV